HPRFVIPALQVILALSAAIWYGVAGNKYPANQDVAISHGYVALTMVMHVNFPLAVFWAPVFLFLEWASASSYINISNGPAVMAIGSLLGLAIVTSIASFSYLVVTEVELRSQGRSLIRFSSGTLEMVKAVVLAALGVSGMVYAYWGSSRQLR